MFKAEFKNLDSAIEQLTRYKESIRTKEKVLLERLAFLGATRVEMRFAEALYTDLKNISVSVDKKGNEMHIRVDGKDAVFIEFGAGVFYEDFPYLGNKPSGVVPLGEYGKKRGRNKKGWYFTDKSGMSNHTKGNPPSMAMYKTSVELAELVLPIVKEVFSR